MFVVEVIATLLSLLSIILVGVLAQTEGSHENKTFIVVFTISSVVFALSALLLNVLEAAFKLDIDAARHKYTQASFQYLAQRARQIKWPGMEGDAVVSLLKELETHFAMLKATGDEPEDRDFDAAHVVFMKILNDPDVRIAQSFVAGEFDEAGQHAGDPESPVET